MVGEKRAKKTLKILKKEYPDVKYYLDFSNPLELLVAAILSPMVRDETVNESTPKLFKKFKSAEDYANAKVSEIDKYIKDINFHKSKAKRIKKACGKIVEDFGGKVPKKVEDLEKLSGVGRKTAVAIAINGFDKITGIPCDTHCIRLAYRLGWTKSKKPDKIEEDLQELFPKKEWKKLPWILKAHGRAICKARVPHCSECPVKELCPKKGVKKKK